MNRIDDDTLQAYVDGELDAVAAAQLEAAMALDGALERRVQHARTLRARLQAAFDPVLDEPVPPSLLALLQPGGTAAPGVVDRRRSSVPVGAASRRRAPRRWLAAGAALAASVAVVTLGLSLWTGRGAVTGPDGQQFASGALSDALQEGLASEPDPRADVAIGLTFRTLDGRICRTFVDRRTPANAGLACREAAGWAMQVLSAIDMPEGELRQASSGLPASVQSVVDATRRGDAFDAAEERAARDAGWR